MIPQQPQVQPQGQPQAQGQPVPQQQPQAGGGAPQLDQNVIGAIMGSISRNLKTPEQIQAIDQVMQKSAPLAQAIGSLCPEFLAALAIIIQKAAGGQQEKQVMQDMTGQAPPQYPQGRANGAMSQQAAQNPNGSQIDNMFYTGE